MKRIWIAFFFVTSMLLTLPACADSPSPDDLQQSEAVSSSAPATYEAYAASNNIPAFSDVPDGAW